MSFLSPTPSDSERKRDASAARIADAMQQTGAAFSNKRQSDRDFYADALANRASAYQGAMNMLGASGGAVPNLAGLDRNNNPLTLRDTTVGATAHSNATGWQNPSLGMAHGNKLRGGYTNGIIDYLNGTAVPTGSLGNGLVYGSAYSLPGQATNGTGGSLNTGGGPQGQLAGSATAPYWAQPSGPAPNPPPAPGQGFNFNPRRQ